MQYPVILFAFLGLSLAKAFDPSVYSQHDSRASLLRRTPTKGQKNPSQHDEVKGHGLSTLASPWQELNSLSIDEHQRSPSQPGRPKSGRSLSEHQLNHPTKWPSTRLGLDQSLHHLVRPSTKSQSNMQASLQTKKTQKGIIRHPKIPRSCSPNPRRQKTLILPQIRNSWIGLKALPEMPWLSSEEGSADSMIYPRHKARLGGSG